VRLPGGEAWKIHDRNRSMREAGWVRVSHGFCALDFGAISKDSEFGMQREIGIVIGIIVEDAAPAISHIAYFGVKSLGASEHSVTPPRGTFMMTQFRIRSPYDLVSRFPYPDAKIDVISRDCKVLLIVDGATHGETGAGHA